MVLRSLTKSQDFARLRRGSSHTLKGLDDNQDYPINTFFWFFEAKKDPENAPLSKWINGGPGSSSMMGLLVENGPCIINPDSNSTILNQYSWNNEGELTKLGPDDPIPEQNATLLVGTYPSNEPENTALDSRNAAIALRHFAQVWFQEFPGYHPGDSRISLATEPYGGRHGPAFFAYFEERNQKIENGTWKDDDGDMKTQSLHSKTHTVSKQSMKRFMTIWSTPSLSAAVVAIWSRTAAFFPPSGTQITPASTTPSMRFAAPLRTTAPARVAGHIFGTPAATTTTFRRSSRPHSLPHFTRGGVNQEHVQAALGVPLNWTQSNRAVSTAFRGIGDYPRPGWIEDLAFLLENNIKVSLIYGDRDFACNWMGGEAPARLEQGVLFNNDIATGEIDTVVPLPDNDGDYDCSSEEQIEAILTGKAVLKQWILVDENTTELFPEVVGDWRQSHIATFAE
ncbi:hypothetical protein BDFG_06750 [Blastomyces dermatitidis ATCC 26199]|nr:hypothetical protein BDFG_06750 [Blastomyces dermatitidis ATCC 26199]